MSLMVIVHEKKRTSLVPVQLFARTSVGPSRRDVRARRLANDLILECLLLKSGLVRSVLVSVEDEYRMNLKKLCRC